MWDSYIRPKTVKDGKIINDFGKAKGEVVFDEIENSKNIRFRTSGELDRDYPTWLSGQTTATGQHTTQITSTKSTYEKIGKHLIGEGRTPSEVSILDASSGLGVGTQALREMGFTVEDVEPYPSEHREKPTYSRYEDVEKKYDVVISNAVLNVIPDDWRADVLKSMADKLKVGGRLIINVRDAAGVAAQKQKIELDSPSEILVTDGKGNIRAYQKGFTRKELAEYVKSQLGDGYEVVLANAKNSGIENRTAVVVTKRRAGELRYRPATEMSAIEDASERFDRELETLNIENANNIRLYLGKPSSILRSVGISEKMMLLYGNKVIKKAAKHGFSPKDLMGLAKATHSPIAIFAGNQEGSFVILTELKIGGHNVVVSLKVGKGQDVDFNIITSTYGKSGESVARWITDGKLRYANKEKTLNYLRISAPIAEAQSNESYIMATKIVEEFENPKFIKEQSENFIKNNTSERENLVRIAVEDTVNKFGESVTFVHSSDISDGDKYAEKKRKAKGWYDAQI